MQRAGVRRSTALYLIVAALLLWVTLRQVSLRAIRQELAHIELQQLITLVALNGLVLVTMVIRWWLLLVAQGHAVGWITLLRYRLAAFGVTYFTPGPQFGGEPLQVYLVHRNHGVPLQDAIAAVALDKVLEMLINFGFLVGGVTLLLSQGLLTGALAYGGLALALLLLLLPLLLFFAFLRGSRPLQRLERWLHRQHSSQHSSQSRDGQLPRWLQRLLSTAVAGEAQSIALCHRHPGMVIGALLITFVGWVLMILEFGYAAHALDVPLTVSEIITVMVAARVAYLLPMPAGIGTFESSLALAFHWLHYAPAAGIALSLLIRSRDLILGLLGLGLGGLAFIQRWQNSRQPLTAQQSDDK